MTPGIYPRFASRLMLFAAIIFQWPAPALAQSAASTTPTRHRFATPTLDLDVPGAALAIVRGDEVIQVSEKS
jgi:hypothetical protein